MATASEAVAMENDYMGVSDAASSYPPSCGAEEGEEAEAEEETELELGLSLGANKGRSKGGGGGGQWGDYCRILTAEDFPSLGSRASPLSSSVSSSAAAAAAPAVGGGGLKRAADSVSPPSGQAVVGWPPIRAFRVNSLVNQLKDNADASAKKKAANLSSSCSKTKEGNGSGKGQEKGKGVLFVKVNMDGDPIGRKVDLNAHLSYESLAATLELMFHKPTTPLSTPFDGTKASKLLDGSSEFALTYEDKDGDWMLVGDVPWGMFLSTVKRLRIMRTCDASGIAPRLQSNRAGAL